MAKKILVLDNYDSFTCNLVHGLEAAGGNCIVHRSDAICIAGIEQIEPDFIVLSPGPFGPDQAGVCAETLRAFKGQIPILGVCLGMQVIATFMGAAVRPSGKPLHGKALPVWHDGHGVFRGLPNPFQGARYHSLIVSRPSIPPSLTVSAWGQDGTVLGVRANDWDVDGVMFHPESFLTEYGSLLFSNFLETERHFVVQTA